MRVQARACAAEAKEPARVRDCTHAPFVCLTYTGRGTLHLALILNGRSVHVLSLGKDIKGGSQRKAAVYQGNCEQTRAETVGQRN